MYSGFDRQRPNQCNILEKITNMKWQGTYSSSVRYDFGDVVTDSVKQSIYMCIADNTLNKPLTSTANWATMVSVADAISSANAPTANANTARDNANTATTATNEAATNANTKATNAQAQADYAKRKATMLSLKVKWLLIVLSVSSIEEHIMHQLPTNPLTLWSTMVLYIKILRNLLELLQQIQLTGCLCCKQQRLSLGIL